LTLLFGVLIPLFAGATILSFFIRLLAWVLIPPFVSSRASWFVGQYNWRMNRGGNRLDASTMTDDQRKALEMETQEKRAQLGMCLQKSRGQPTAESQALEAWLKRNWSPKLAPLPAPPLKRPKETEEDVWERQRLIYDHVVRIAVEVQRREQWKWNWLVIVGVVFASALFYQQYQINIIDVRLTTLEIRVDALTRDFIALSRTISSGAGLLDSVEKKVNEKYTQWLGQYETLRAVDTEILKLLGRLMPNEPLIRSKLGLGCFPGGTLIQIDADGKTLPVESLNTKTLVWNPALRKQIPLKLTLLGEETGYLFKFTTKTFNVTVTETHPMKIQGALSSWKNIAARDVVHQTLMETSNGVEQVLEIEKINVEHVMVYNFEYDLPESVPDHLKSVVADGIYTLDFNAQRKHHLRNF